MSEYTGLTEGAAYLRRVYRGLYEALGRHGAHPHLIDDDPGRFTADCPVCGGAKSVTATPKRISCDFCRSGSGEIYARISFDPLNPFGISDRPQGDVDAEEKPPPSVEDESWLWEVPTSVEDRVVNRDEVRQDVKDRDRDRDRDRSKNTTTTGFSDGNCRAWTLAEDGLPPAWLGGLIRRYKNGTLKPGIEVPMKIPSRGSTLRSLAEWIRVCFAVRLDLGMTEPMGFSISLACSLLGWDPENCGDRANASNAIHRLEALGVVEFVGTVPVRGRDKEMRCFLPVGVSLEALLDGEPPTLTVVSEREEAA